MGFKDLFIERDEPTKETERFIPENTMGDSDYMEYSPVEAPANDTEVFVSDVYDRNNLSDVSKSIFKVEELSSTLPEEMPNDVKRQTVLGIMTAVGLSADQVINDGMVRIQALEESKNTITDNLTAEIQKNESTIESLKIQISELQKDNSMKRAQIISVKDSSDKEVNRIKGLIGFLGTASMFEQEEKK